MSVSARTPGVGQSAEGAGPAVPGAADRDPAGLLLARLGVAPALVASAFLVAGFPLLVAGAFRPVPVILLSVVVAAVVTPLGLRAVPGLRPPATAARPRLWAQPGDPAAGGDARRTPWWPVAGVLVVAVAFFAFNAAYHSQFLVISRDPGAYLQFGTWIAGHGKLPVATSSAAFGGAKGIAFDGFAMYQVGNTVVPQFMAGLPMALAVGLWAGGVNGALLMAPLFGAVAVVVFGGLAARLLGARWAPLAALVIAVSEPLMFTSRSTYSEPLAFILFMGGVSLVIDSLRAGEASAGAGQAGAGGLARGLRARVVRWDGGRVLGLLGGLALGISMLVRIDSPAEVLPVIPYVGLLLVRRQRQAVPIIIGMAIGWAWGWWDAVFLSYPYVFWQPPLGNWGSTRPMIEIMAAVVVVTVAGCLWLRRRMRVVGALPQVGEHWYLPRWLPAAAAVLPFVVLAVFAARPHLQPGLEEHDYVQLTLHWVYWYLGGPAIALAGVGAAVLAYGCLRGRYPAWALPLMVFGWDIVLFLYRPGISPDQPWASRRLVPAVLPGFILLATWTVAWACGRVRRGEVPGAARLGGLAAWLTGSRRGRTAAAIVTACAVLLVVPAGLGARGTVFKRTYTNQVAAIYGLCAQLPADASVVIVDGSMGDRWSQTVRGMCDVPVARFPDNADASQDPAAPVPLVQAAVASIERIGRRPVLLAATQKELAPFAGSGTVTRVVNVQTTLDGRSNTSAPTGIAPPQQMTAWMWQPGR